MMEPPLSVLGTRRTPAPEPPAPGQTRGRHSPRAIFRPLSPGAEPTTAQADWPACSLCRPGGRAEATGKCPGDSTPPGHLPSHCRRSMRLLSTPRPSPAWPCSKPARQSFLPEGTPFTNHLTGLLNFSLSEPLFISEIIFQPLIDRYTK